MDTTKTTTISHVMTDEEREEMDHYLKGKIDVLLEQKCAACTVKSNLVYKLVALVAVGGCLTAAVLTHNLGSEWLGMYALGSGVVTASNIMGK